MTAPTINGRATLQDVWAQCQLAGLSPTTPNGGFLSLCPLCSGQVSYAPSDEGRIVPTCAGGCDPSRIADELHVREQRATAAGVFPRRARLEEIEQAMRGYLHLPTTDHVRFALAVGVSAQLDGDPLWGLLVGPPSSGKTEAVRALDDIAEHVDELTSASLLAWLPPGAKGRPVGLLTRVGARAFATVADLSTVLAMSDRGLRDQLFAMLRRAYDGRVVRELATAPHPLRWEGRLTLLAAVTPAIDNFSSHADALGPRWLYLRMPNMTTTERRAASDAARRSQPQLERHRAVVRALVAGVVGPAAELARSIELGEAVAGELFDAAAVTCLGRATVPRHGYGKREIEGMPTIEEPPRLVGQLSLLARGLLALGLDDQEAVRLARRAALDSMPQDRRAVLAALAGGEAKTATQIERDHGINRMVATQALQELADIGVCAWPGMHEEDADEKRLKPWRLAGDDAAMVARVLSADMSIRKGGETHTSPPVNGAPHTSERRNEGGPR